MKYEKKYIKRAEHTYFWMIYLRVIRRDERIYRMTEKFEMIEQLWLVFAETSSNVGGRGVAGTKGDGDGLRLDSAASPFGARRESGDAPFHSQTADIANPFQNISFLNASSSRWITNLSITSLSQPTFHVAEATNTTRRLLPSSLLKGFRRKVSFRDRLSRKTIVIDKPNGSFIQCIGKEVVIFRIKSIRNVNTVALNPYI